MGRRLKPHGTQDPSEDGAESVISLEPKRSLNSDGLLQRTQADGKVCPVEVLRSDRQILAPVSRKPHTCPLNRFSQLHRPGDLSSSSQRSRVAPMGCTKGNGQGGASYPWGSDGDFLQGPSRGPSTFRCAVHLSCQEKFHVSSLCFVTCSCAWTLLPPPSHCPRPNSPHRLPYLKTLDTADPQNPCVTWG